MTVDGNIIFSFLFFTSLLLFLHSYFFYPVSIWFAALLFKKQYRVSENYRPHVSVLISAFNEEKVIEKTIRILEGSDYPREKIEIVVGSDNSSDSTDAIVQKLSLEFENIKLISFNQRRGKSQVINDIAERASGEILVFSDANTIYDKSAMKNLVKYFEDSRVGGVSGKLKLLDYETSKYSGSQEKKYWDVETWLKEQEGYLGILIGANGGIYCIRREHFEKIPTDRPVMDDFFISLMVLRKRKDFLYIKNAFAEEYAAPTIQAEFYRKVRNNSIMMSTINVIKDILNPAFGLRAYALWSHKIIRWFSPVLLIILFTSNLFLLWESDYFKSLLIIQCGFYIIALIGHLLLKINFNIVPILLCHYFVMTNIAMLIGLIKFVFNKHTAFWQSTPR